MTVYLPLDFELEWTPGFFAARNSNDDGYTFAWDGLLVLSREIVDGWSWFAEFESTDTAERGDPWVGAVNLGVTWDVHDDLVLEFGTGLGVTRSADDFSLFITLVQRS